MLLYAVTETDCKNIIPRNIIFYRKSLKLTQSELAEKLNYSDKAVSKWERGEAVPGVVVLNQMAVIFGISLDTLCSDHTLGKSKATTIADFLRNRLLISLMSAGLVWLVATAVFVFGAMIAPEFAYFWMAFIYAIPCTAIVLIVFNALWGKRWVTFVLVSVLVWSVALSLHLSIPLTRSFLFFIIPVPLQILVILWSFLKKIKGRVKK